MELTYSEKPLTTNQFWRMTFDLTKKYTLHLYFFVLVIHMLSKVVLLSILPKGVDSFVFHGNLSSFASSYIILCIVSLLFTIFISITVLHQLGNFLEGHPFELFDSIIESLKKLPLALLTTALAAIYVFALPSFIVFILLKSAAVDFKGFLFLSYISLIIYIIIMSVRLSMILPIIVFEKCGPIKAIKMSRNLTRGHWWIILGALICGLVPGLSIGSVGIAGELLFAPLTAVFFNSVIILLWHDLKVRKNLLPTPQDQKITSKSSDESIY